MNREEAIRLVEEEINRDYREEGDSLVVVDRLTQEKPYGWVFFYGSRTYLETSNPDYMIGGNGPVVFERDTGKIVQLGTAFPPEEEIARFELPRSGAFTLQRAFAHDVSWRKTTDVDHPWEATVGGHLWRIRLGDFPAETSYGLIVEGTEIGTFDDWPKNWSRPKTQ